jgi:hypothetical protein
MLRPAVRFKLLVAVALLLVAAHVRQHFHEPERSIVDRTKVHYQDWRANREKAARQSAIDVQTTKLPAVDSVIVCTIDEANQSQDTGVPVRLEGESAGILDSAKLIGTDAEQLATMWRGLEFGGMGAMCHYPVYGLRFFSRGKLFLEATLCWQCGNCYLMSDGKFDSVGFQDADQRFLDHLQTIVPLPLATQSYIARERARSHILFQDYAKAYVELDKAERLDPANGSTDEIRSNIFQFRGDHPRAIEAYSRAIQKSPDLELAFRERALLRAVAGDYRGALADYQDSIHGPYYRNDIGEQRGLCLVEVGEFDRALEDFCVAIQPAFPKVFVTHLRERAIECRKVEQGKYRRLAVLGLSELYDDCANKLETYLQARIPNWLSPDGRYTLVTQPDPRGRLAVVVRTLSGKEVWRSAAFAVNSEECVVLWGSQDRIWLFDNGCAYNWRQAASQSWMRTIYVQDYASPTPEEIASEARFVRRMN